MAIKQVKGVSVPRHDTAINWSKAINFIPKKGELIVYDADTSSYTETITIGTTQCIVESSDKVRFKFGDGASNVNILPFATTENPNGSGVGKTTPQGGEIFNDYENNQSISEFSSAKGTYTFTGTKFFYIIDKNEINKTYTLKDYYLDISSSGELAVNDLFSITTGGNREDCGTIKSITQEEGTNNAIVTVSNWYWDNSTGLTEPTYDNPSTYFIFRVIDKPLCGTDIMGTGASSEGYSTKALMIGCHSEGYSTIAGGKYSHAEGKNTRSGYASHAEGWGTKAMGLNAHSEGHFTDAQGWYSHSEGNNTKSIGQSSHAEGANTEASGSQAHAEGSNTLASNFNTHAEGNNTQATKNEAHAEGRNTTASGGASHAEGVNTVAGGYSSHAEGRNTKASDSKAHAEGENTTASGYSSHAEGGNTVASGGYSHAGGLGTIASGSSQTSIGKYNREDVNALLIVGNGSGPEDENRSNAFEVGKNGTATLPSLKDSNGNPDPTAIGTSEYSVATKGYVDTIKNDAVVFDMYHPFDLNHDGIVDLNDVELISQYVAGHDMPLYPWLGTPYYSTEYLWGDINGDGNEDLDDTDLLAQYVAGWDVTSPVLDYYVNSLIDYFKEKSTRHYVIYHTMDSHLFKNAKSALKEATSLNNEHPFILNIFITDTNEGYTIMGGQVFKLNKEE